MFILVAETKKILFHFQQEELEFINLPLVSEIFSISSVDAEHSKLREVSV